MIPGQFVTVKGGGIASTVIEKFTHAPVSHAYVYIGMQPNGYDMVEAEPGGIRYGNTTNYRESYPSKAVWTPEQSQHALALCVDAAERRLPYGWVADFFIGLREGIGLPIPSAWFKIKAVTTHRECAQFADLIGIKTGHKYFDDDRLPGSVSPADLWRLDYTA